MRKKGNLGAPEIVLVGDHEVLETRDGEVKDAAGIELDSAEAGEGTPFLGGGLGLENTWGEA
jgi:hypothetical protein